MSFPASNLAPTPLRRILIVDPDEDQRTVMARYLAGEHEVVEESNTDRAQEILRSSDPFHLVLCALSSRPVNGLRFAPTVREIAPTAQYALVTSRTVEPHLSSLRRANVRNALITTKPFNFYEFRLAVDNLLFPERAFGLRRYLREPKTVVDLTIQTQQDRDALPNRLEEFFRRYRRYDSDVSEMRLACEELVNNALFHAFRRPTGLEKYAAGRFTALEPHEHVLVSLGRDNTYVGVAVRDNQGVLAPDRILENIERQFSLTGIMDLNGRGLYLTRQLADRMIVNVDPGVATEVVLLFAIDNSPVGPRPILINVVPKH